MLSREDQARLAHAIRDVEDDTSGEIVVVIAEQAGITAPSRCSGRFSQRSPALAADLAHGAQREPDPH